LNSLEVMSSSTGIKTEQGLEQPELDVKEKGPKKSLRWAADVTDASSNTETETRGCEVSADNNNNKKNNNSRMEQATNNNKKTKPLPQCIFCRRYPAAVVMKVSWKGKRQPLCMLHYYTTTAVHAEPQHVKVLDQIVIDQQVRGLESELNPASQKLNVQELFAEAFVQLQQELAQESLTIVAVDEDRRPPIKNPRKLDNDPLSMLLHDLGRKKRRLKPPPPPPPPVPSARDAASSSSKGGGGFLRPVPIPERLRKTQQQQAKIQAEQTARMNQAASAKSIVDTSKRRKVSRRSIWNSVMDQQEDDTTAGSTLASSSTTTKNNTSVPNNTFREIDLRVEGVLCSCGSTNIMDIGSVTSRNQCSKEEVWGGKDRIDEVVLKYRCNDCGKVWQESG